MGKTNTLGRKLIKARKKRKLTVWRAAEQAGINRESLLRLETGRTDPEKALVSTMLAIVDYYWPAIELTDFVNDDRFNHLGLYASAVEEDFPDG